MGTHTSFKGHVTRSPRDGLSKIVTSREAYVVGGVDESVIEDTDTGGHRIFLALVAYHWKPSRDARDALPGLQAALRSPDKYQFQVYRSELAPVPYGQDYWPFWGNGIVGMVQQFNSSHPEHLKLLFIDGGNHSNIGLRERLDEEGVKARFEQRKSHGYRRKIHPLLPYVLEIADSQAVLFRKSRQ